MHNLAAICTEIKICRNKEMSWHTLFNGREIFQRREWNRSQPGRIGNETPIRATEDGRRTESLHDTKDRKADGGAGSARNS